MLDIGFPKRINHNEIPRTQAVPALRAVVGLRETGLQAWGMDGLTTWGMEGLRRGTDLKVIFS